MKKGLKALFGRYEFELLVLGGLFIVYKCWGLFSALGSVTDGLSTIAAGATASIKDASEKAAAKVKVKTVNPSASDSDISVFQQSARTLAGCLGRLPGVWTNYVYPDRKGAFDEAKKYSHFMLNGSKPVLMPGSKTLYQVRKAELRLSVLAPLYKDITAGRDLFTDLDGAMRLWPDDYNTLYFKYLK